MARTITSSGGGVPPIPPTGGSQILQWIRQYAAQYGVPLGIALRQAQAESSWNPNAISSTGAIGLYQLEPGTAQTLGVNPWSVQQNIQGGLKYDAQLYRMFGGSWTRALEAYNEGPGALTSQLLRHQAPPSAVQAYAQQIVNGTALPTPPNTTLPSGSSASGGALATAIQNLAQFESNGVSILHPVQSWVGIMTYAGILLGILLLGVLSAVLLFGGSGAGPMLVGAASRGMGE